MDMEDALRHALSLIDEESERIEESERLLNEPDHQVGVTLRGACADWKWANDAANDVLSELLALTRGGPNNA